MRCRLGVRYAELIMINPNAEALSTCFPLIKTLSAEGSVLVVGNLASSEVPPEFKAFFLEKHLRQILFWEAPEMEKGTIQSYSPHPYSPHHLWARSPKSLSWNHLGHFDVIWILPDTLQSLDLTTMKNVFHAVCQQSHFTVLCAPREKLKTWMKQAGLNPAHQQKNYMKNHLNRAHDKTGDTAAPQSLYFSEMEAFFAKHLPGIFWGQGAEANQDIFQFIATQKPHTQLELETFQQELNQTIAFETALLHFNSQQVAREKALQQQQADASRIEKANQLAKLLSKKTLSL